MGLEALLAKLESHAAVTPGTPRYADGVPPRPTPGKACTPGTPGTPRNDNAESNARALAATDALPNVGIEARRQRVVDSIPDTVIVTVASRGVGVGWILVPKDRFDGLAVLAMLERHNQTFH